MQSNMYSGWVLYDPWRSIEEIWYVRMNDIYTVDSLVRISRQGRKVLFIKSNRTLIETIEC